MLEKEIYQIALRFNQWKAVMLCQMVSPGELTFRRYERFARGGAGLIWF